ncbi:signal recognition particle-docking protein FtsY [Gammaproteobacteria bacterium]|nr:signal recognition particle-docking protein FtsY [Gammaproteobacteria bacterium]
MGNKVPTKGGGWLAFKSGLAKTRRGFLDGFGSLVLGEKEIGPGALEALETSLLRADVGTASTEEVLGELTKRVQRKELSNFDGLISQLKGMLVERLESLRGQLAISSSETQVFLFVGVNGAGKTTTIGKLTERFSNEGHAILLAAGDTFRAAAREQLGEWAKKSNVHVLGQGRGSDSSSVVYDAFESARAKQVDILMIDTAGRLQANDQLMEELRKVKRVLKKIDSEAPHQIILVLDSNTGQNAVNQLTAFNEALGLTGLVLTKLDGTAKAGFLLPLAEQIRKIGLPALPLYFVGFGEKASDLHEFEPETFVNAMLDFDEQDNI